MLEVVAKALSETTQTLTFDLAESLVGESVGQREERVRKITTASDKESGRGKPC